MGGRVNKPSCRFDQIKQYEFREFGQQYQLQVSEVETIYLYFRRLSRHGQDIGVIPREQFFQVLGLQESRLTNRMFLILD